MTEAAQRVGVSERAARRVVARWYTEPAQVGFQWVPLTAPARRTASVPRRRRVAAGVGLTLLFVPAGWVASAALFGGGTDSFVGVGRAHIDPQSIDFQPNKARELLDRKYSTGVATVPGDHVEVYRWADRKHATHYRLDARHLDNGTRLPLVFSVISRKPGWLYINLPTRPNLSHAWIRASAAQVRQTPYLLDVALRAHRITVYRNGKVLSHAAIGVGASVNPTPTGRYFLTDLVKPPTPNGLYGAYAFGTSAHSDVLTTFGTGDGQIGLHGTNDPASLGANVSHGCIRVSNKTITWLAHNVPLGTPLVIRRGQPHVVAGPTGRAAGWATDPVRHASQVAAQVAGSTGGEAAVVARSTAVAGRVAQPIGESAAVPPQGTGRPSPGRRARRSL